MVKKDWRLDIALFLVRIVLGIVLLYYGSQKMFGLFGGQGYGATIADMGRIGIHPILANLSIFTEVLGGLCVLAGLLTPLMAAAVSINMSVAFYVNVTKPGAAAALLSGTMPAATAMIFFTLTILVCAVSLILLGAGSISFDSQLFRPAKKR